MTSGNNHDFHGEKLPIGGRNLFFPEFNFVGP